MLVDADTDAFNAVLAALRLPKGTDEEKQARAAAMEAANRGAIEVPLRVMETALASMEVIEAMAKDGMKQSASDAGVAALCARSAVLGAGLNVQINLPSIEDEQAARNYRGLAEMMSTRAIETETKILALVEGRL